MIHKKRATINSWDFRSKEGWSIVIALDYYCCDQLIPRDTKAVTILDAVDFLHQYITAPTVTPVDCILHIIHTLTGAIKQTPIAVYDAQLKAIKALQYACHRWASPGTPENHPDPIAPWKTLPLRQSPRVSNTPVPPTPPLPPPRVQTLPIHQRPAPRVGPPIVNLAPPPRVAPKTQGRIVHDPVVKRTRSNRSPIYNPIALRTYAQTKKISHGHASPSGQTLLPTSPVSPVVHADPGNGNARIRCRNGKNLGISAATSASQI